MGLRDYFRTISAVFKFEFKILLSELFRDMSDEHVVHMNHFAAEAEQLDGIRRTNIASQFISHFLSSHLRYPNSRT